VSPVKYELGSYIPVDGIFHSDVRHNLKSPRPGVFEKRVLRRLFEPKREEVT
jgi:hypothetical protein